MIFFILLLCLLLTGCAAPEASPAVETTIPETTVLPETVPPETAPPDPIRLMLNHMSLEERVGQLFLARCDHKYALRR